MKFRHYFLFVVFAIATVVSLWAVAHTYLGVAFPFFDVEGILFLGGLLGCNLFGLFILAARHFEFIQKDQLVDLLMLPILILAGLTGPNFAQAYIWVFGLYWFIVSIKNSGRTSAGHPIIEQATSCDVHGNSDSSDGI